ncbi:HET-domain-containing protein [Rhizodiscina lignyota]|uniref:HET-domain-containing protein n=1 Tax=Rhizodiscina lignyota TaxID=1504668 RepID=A0A9P4M2V6_9PEZI|nr:HET-domain-containing protein [Rhizodiscina lignyota]
MPKYANGFEINNHPSCHVQGAVTVSGFQLLNCTTRLLESYSPGTEFVALSYVWGQNSPKQDHQEAEHGASNLPQTIEDALEVTKHIGYNYIWIDRYCIPKSSSLKHDQIASMDAIYKGSVVTITAACGSGSGSGLTGVSRNRRIAQSRVDVGGLDLVSALTSPVTEVGKSTWIRRGWTYQEGLLSRRRLFFTESQIYFECCGNSCMETVAEPKELMQAQNYDKNLEQTYGDNRLIMSSRHRVFSSADSSFNPWSIQFRIAEYTQRTLTFDSDRLDAFLGIFRVFRIPKSKCPISHVWGVPVLWSNPRWTTTEGFATGLCWTLPFRHYIPPRCLEFPSWSWAGWKTSISPDAYYYRYGFKMPYEIDFTFELTDGTLMPWDTYQSEYQSELQSDRFLAPALSRYLHVDGWSLEALLIANPSVTEHSGPSTLHRWELVIENVMGTTKIPATIHKAYSEEGWERKADILIIGNPETPVSPQWTSYSKEPPCSPFLIVLEDMGSHHERIGYAGLLNVHEKPGTDLSLCLKGRQRRRFRLG